MRPRNQPDATRCQPASGSSVRLFCVHDCRREYRMQFLNVARLIPGPSVLRRRARRGIPAALNIGLSAPSPLGKGRGGGFRGEDKKILLLLLLLPRPWPDSGARVAYKIYINGTSTTARLHVTDVSWPCGLTAAGAGAERRWREEIASVDGEVYADAQTAAGTVEFLGGGGGGRGIGEIAEVRRSLRLREEKKNGYIRSERGFTIAK